jgi:adenylate kinase family enzyme
MTSLNKIVIVGTSGCGKTTLGRQLAKTLHIKHVDLDDLYWLPNWIPRADEEFFSLIQRELDRDGWIICGNYSRAQEQVWKQADTIIWLDLPLYTCLWRAFKRSMKSWIKHEPCCNGNYETIRRIFGKDSIILWVWNTYFRRKKAYTQYFALNNSNHRLIRLQNDHEIQKFLSNCQ